MRLAIASSVITTVAILLLSTPPATAQSRQLPVVGTGDGIDMLRDIAARYNQTQNDVRIEIPPSIGSGGGIAAVGNGKAELGRIARPLSDAEKASQIDYLPLARISSAFFVNSAAGIKALTSQQLLDIYAGRLSNWKEVGGADIRIRVVRRENEDSTLSALRKNMPGWKDLVITDRSKMALTTQEATETVREVAGAIGFGPYTTSLQSGASLVVLAIDGRMPTDPAYPSSVELALISKAGMTDAGARGFLTFVTSAEARKAITDIGGIPVAAAK